MALLITILIIVCVFAGAAFIIRRSLPGDMQTIAMVVAGVACLLWLVLVVMGYGVLPIGVDARPMRVVR